AVSLRPLARRRSSRMLLIAFALSGALLGFLAVSHAAAGYGVNFCTGWLPSGARCEGPGHTLTANFAYDGTGSNAYVCEMATNSSGGTVGGWGCGYGYAE